MKLAPHTAANGTILAYTGAIVCESKQNNILNYLKKYFPRVLMPNDKGLSLFQCYRTKNS